MYTDSRISSHINNMCYISLDNNKYKVMFCLWCVGSVKFSLIALPGERRIKLSFEDEKSSGGEMFVASNVVGL